jgi:flagellin-like protein
VLPANAQRSLVDPYAEKGSNSLIVLLLLLAVTVVLGIWKVGWLAF